MFPNLEAEMARRKISRQHLAKVLECTPTTLSLKLNGKSIITLAECIKIRDFIDKELSIDYLFKAGELNPAE